MIKNYINDCINGDALMEDIDDYISQWHHGSGEQDLHEFLGMTLKEYALYIEDEAYLGSIITAHKDGEDIKVVVEEQLQEMIARSDNQQKSARLGRWLKSEGHWE